MIRRELVGADEVAELFRIDFSYRWVFVITVCLAGDDLPFAVAPQPGVGDVITRRQILAEDGFGFVGVVAQNSGVTDDPALDLVDLDGAGISGRHRRDVGNQFGFIERAAFLVGEDAVVGKIFFPRSLITRHDGVVQLLRPTNEFVLGDRYISGVG